MTDAMKAHMYGLNAFLNILYNDERDFSRLGETDFLYIPEGKYIFTHVREGREGSEFCLRKTENLKFYDIARIRALEEKIQVDVLETGCDKDSEKLEELKRNLEGSIYKHIISFE